MATLRLRMSRDERPVDDQRRDAERKAQEAQERLEAALRRRAEKVTPQIFHLHEGRFR